MNESNAISNPYIDESLMSKINSKDQLRQIKKIIENERIMSSLSPAEIKELLKIIIEHETSREWSV